MPKLTELITFPYAAELAGVSKHTITEWARQGVLPTYKLCGGNRLRLADLEALVTPRTVKPRDDK